jgi:hypothetical protein
MNMPRDPRETITPDSFTIDPALLGQPLARPARRAAAMAIDLGLIALLVWAGGFLFGVAAAWVFLRISNRAAGGGVLRRSSRFVARAAAALILFLVVMNAVGSWRRGRTPPPERAGWEHLSQDEAEQAIRREIADRMASEGVDPDDILRGAAPSRPGTAPADDSSPSAGAARLDSLLDAYVAARAADRTAVADSLIPSIRGAIAADTVEVLAARARRVAEENRRLRAERDEARQRRGILSFLRSSADDFGLTFGWSGLYFTGFLALWNGQTPGKRIARIRVLRLDGKPMTWWASFERFGGYAASIFTGLLGFVQIFWDRNRQGMHDKITETVVVRL